MKDQNQMTSLSEPPMERCEWDFDDVPDGELIACCFWEYARESHFIRGVRELCLRNWRAGGNWNLKLNDDLETLQSIGYPSDVFIRGFFFEPDVEEQCQDEKLPNYRHPDAPPITGSFPKPWKSLSEDERQCRAIIGSSIRQFQIVPIKLAHWSITKDIARQGQRVADKHHEQRTNWEKEYLRRDEKGASFSLPDAPKPPEFEAARPSMRWGFVETLLVDIAWQCFTNDEIANYFRKWVKLARPKEIPAPDGKGRNKAGHWRANLTRLAVLRLLARFTPLEIVDPRKDKYPAVWKTKQFSRSQWRDVTKWHDARRQAGKVFHALFPFLQKDEKPISWVRQSPSK